MEAAASIPWWVWPIALAAVGFLIGVVAVLAGIGGGVLFVPVVGSFFPFHLDFVRGAGLLFALAGTLSAGPLLLRARMASLRLIMPLALARRLRQRGAGIGRARRGAAHARRIPRSRRGPAHRLAHPSYAARLRRL